MEFLCAIATAIVGKFAEYTVDPVVRQISYVTGCKGNLQQLDAAVEKLKAAKESVANEVGEAERRGERIQPDVQLWLKKVDEITAKTDQFQDERPAELKCFHGGFFCNLKIRHHISRKSTKMVPEVVELDEKRGFSTVSCGILRQEVCGVSTGDYQAFASRTSTMKKIMDELKNPNSKRIGVYGIGGVGKTTLVQQVYKQATEVEKTLFDDVVILLDVKENPDLGGIQMKIVEKLGMTILANETMEGRASRLCARIQDKKTLVILDDVWEEIKLEAVGIPSVPTCKILLTSRSRKALSDMSTDKDFALNNLEDEETWVLFENKAGDVVMDPAIRKVAIQIAQCCKGLPVLVVTIASTLKKRTSLPPWKDALRRLEESNSQELTEKAYLGLEWSYSQLNRDELQPFFLLCGIVIRGNKIILIDLLRYGMGLGFLGKLSTLDEERNKVLSLIEELKDFCLLIEDDNNEYVRMHDLVRDVANRIAVREYHILSSVLDGGGHVLKEWWDKDFLEKCRIISLPCGNKISRLPKVLQCQALKMLLLQGDRNDDLFGLGSLPRNRDDQLLTILPIFSEEMKQLNVLALENVCIPSLPSPLPSLKNVRTLCLERCNLGDTMVGELSNLEILSFANSTFEKLPKEIAQSIHLRLLDLTNCYQLKVIPPGVLSSLTRLEDLRMNTFEKWDAEGNASLLELKHLSQLTSLQINIPDANILPANLFSCFELERYEIVIAPVGWLAVIQYDGTLNTLKIAASIQLDKGLEMLLKKSHQMWLAGTFGSKNTLDHQLGTEEFKQLKRLHLRENFDFSYFINRKVEFPSLTTLRVDKCHGLRFLFSSSMARSLVELKDLAINSCKNMEEIVLSTRGEDGEENMDNLFPKLQSLRLEYLPKLVRFCTSSYIEFSSLEELELINCYELKSFICDPLNSGEKDREETALQYSLFNEKVVGCRSLETLKIEDSGKLQTIWQNQLVAHQDSFCRLRDVNVTHCRSLINMFPPSIMGRLNALKTINIFNCKSLKVVFEVMGGPIDDVKAETAHVDTSSSKSFYCRNLDSIKIKFCDSLQNIFPVAVARGLQQLHELEVRRCDQLEGIIGAEADGEIENTPHELVFPSISSLEFTDLHQLQSFCTAGIHISKWPSLKKLVVLTSQVSFLFGEKHDRIDPKAIDRRPLFLIQKDSFPQLEQLTLVKLKYPAEIWYGDGPSSADFFPKLKSVCFREWAPFSNQAALLFLDKLPNLEKIKVQSDDSDEIFVGEGSGDSSGEIYALPRVRFLKLRVAHNLLHLGNQSAAAASLVPNLQFLELECCGRLNSLDQSSAIPFRNLTTLKVTWCHGLKYLISYSVAKTLVQLKTMQVEDCDNIEVIIAAESHEIVHFHSTLQYLKLRNLPRLQGFSSPNCIVKFPSLETFKASEDMDLKIDGVQVVRISKWDRT